MAVCYAASCDIDNHNNNRSMLFHNWAWTWFPEETECPDTIAAIRPLITLASYLLKCGSFTCQCNRVGFFWKSNRLLNYQKKEAGYSRSHTNVPHQVHSPVHLAAYLFTERLQQLCAEALSLGSRELWISVLLSETNQRACWRAWAEAKSMAFLN